jgi:hypothetical protein
MDMGATSAPAWEMAPGRDGAAAVLLAISGHWRRTIRVAPRGQPSASFVYDLAVSPEAATPRAAQ